MIFSSFGACIGSNTLMVLPIWLVCRRPLITYLLVVAKDNYLWFDSAWFSFDAFIWFIADLLLCFYCCWYWSCFDIVLILVTVASVAGFSLCCCYCRCCCFCGCCWYWIRRCLILFHGCLALVLQCLILVNRLLGFFLNGTIVIVFKIGYSRNNYLLTQ